MEKKSLGAFIALLRKEKALTQKQLAELLNVSDKTVSHWECDETSPDISLLPILAETLGVSVDELLSGRKKQQFYSSSQLTPHTSVDRIPNNFRIFKVSNIITAALSVVSVILGVGIKYLLVHFIYTQSANVIAFFVTLSGIFLSLVLTVIFHTIFVNKLNPNADNFCKYRFSANRISSLNSYFGFLCLSLTIIFMREHGFIFLLITLVVSLITEYTLQKKGVLSTEKAFQSPLKENIYRLRKFYAVLCTLLIVFGGGVHFFFSGVYHPSLDNIVFDNPEDFKAYMETPGEKPEEAYKVDAAFMTTYIPTTIISPDEDYVYEEVYDGEEEPGVDTPPSQEDVPTDTIIDYTTGRPIVTFKVLNKNVYDYSYYENEGTFHVITYEAKLKQKDLLILLDDGFGILMHVYYAAVVIGCILAYKKKIKQASHFFKKISKNY